MNRLLLFFYLVLFVYLASLQLAYALYDNCYFGLERSSYTTKKTVTVRPIGSKCYDICKKECSDFFQKDGKDIRGFNVDIIEQCTQQCRAGNLYKSFYREPSNNVSNYAQTAHLAVENSINGLPKNKIFATQSACVKNDPTHEQSAEYIYHATGVMVGHGGIVGLVKLASGTTNLVSLCGTKTLLLWKTPANQAGFQGTNSPSAPEYNLHPSYYSFDPEGWCKNSDKWLPKNKQVPADCKNNNGTIKGDSNSPEYWNARNADWTRTIEVKDGGFLEITYSGNLTACKVPKPGGQFECSDDPKYYRLLIKDPKNQNWEDQNSSYALPGELLVPKPPSQNSSNIPVTTLDNAFYGLSGSSWYSSRVNDIQISNSLKTQLSRFATQPDPSTKLPLEPHVIYQFSGVLKGFSDKFVSLGIKHFGDGDWSNNLGGYDVTITWTGCIFEKGQRLQYAVVPQGLGNQGILAGLGGTNPISFLPQNGSVQGSALSAGALSPSAADQQSFRPELAQWQDVPIDQLKSEGFLINSYQPGQIFLRIKPLQRGADAVPNNFNAAYADGQYTVLVSELPPNNDMAGIDEAVGQIQRLKNELFGEENGKLGTVPRIFKAIVSDREYLSSVKGLLVLYITMTGVLFLAGVVQLTQKDLFARIMKIAVISVLVSPKSWDFFNIYLFKIFTDGSFELADLLIKPILLMQNPQSSNGIFGAFNNAFRMLFNDLLWIKIASLMVSSIFGVLLALVVAVACIVYIVCMIKILLIYLTSAIFTGVLLLVAPIFLCFILFNYTRYLFDNWIKQLISFALQPIFVLVAFTITTELIRQLLISILSFGVCKVCWIELDIPYIKKFCLAEVYKPLLNMHIPPGLEGIGINAAGIIAVFIMVSITYSMCGLASSFASIFASGVGGVNLGRVVGAEAIVKRVSGGLPPILTAIGRDSNTKKVAQRHEQEKQDGK